MQEGYRKFTAEEQEQMYQDALRKRQERQKRLAEDAAKNATASIPASQAQIIQPIQVKRSIPNDFFAPIAKPVEPAHKKPSISLPTIKPKLQLISESKFEITATPSVITALQQVGLLTGPVKDGKIQVPLASRNALVNKLPFNVRPSSNDDIPKTVLTAFEPGAVAQRNAAKNIKINLQNSIPDKLLQDMFPFQVEGVKSAIARGGKILIGDEMGLGKSLQALAVASYYRFEWPLLIVAPASMVANWREQVYTWIPELQKEQVQAVFSGVKVAELTGSVVIMSYDLACRLADLIKQKNFRVIIADESHCMRNAKTKRCKTMIPILQATPRSILLSGTPALSRPCELHSQISAIMPKLFPKSMDYDRRYCDGHQTYFGWDNKGSSNETELTTILENLIMIRRTKDQVLSQLPPKLRRQIFLEIPQDAKKKLKASTEELFNPELLVDGADVDALLRSMSNNNRYLQLYRDTAKAKMPAMLDYISDLLDAGHKFILFVHHMETLDQFSQYFEKEKIKFIKISGNTKIENRHELCTKFQSEEDVRVALLGITAASVGLTLTKANLVVFAELHFTPGILQQAEDRAHRIGQVYSVNVHYLLARGTADDLIWPLIKKKLQTLESLGLGKNEFSDMKTFEHDPAQLKIDNFFTKTSTP